MEGMRHTLQAFILVLVSGLRLLAQETVVSGKVTDAGSGDPLPFVNVVFKGTSIGTTTDFEGIYRLKTSHPADSLTASYVGYVSRTKAVQRGKTQTINFQLEEQRTNLQEVVVLAGENPAWAILRRVVDNKKINDKRRLTAYEYDTYTKIEIDADNITDQLREKKFMQKITRVMDSVERIAGEDGRPVLPVFFTESLSRLYFRDNPQLKHEKILKSKINGLGVEDGTLVTQVIGASFQEYNFYQNWLNILEKDFVSPISDGWRIYYEYDLVDSLYIGDEFCYRLDYFPKSPQDLAFRGTIWITKKDYALKQIDAQVGKEANLNFVEKLKIQQELEKTEEGAWLPSKNRVVIDIGEINDRMAGLLAKFYTSNRDVKVNHPYEVAFYARPIEMDEGVRLNESESYWDSVRHDPLSATEKDVFKMIDTLRNIPVVKTYTDIIKILVNGYWKRGKVDLGPYMAMLAWNTVEGVRIQGGFRTNYAFSKKWVLGAQLAYGFDDERVKYSASVQHILQRTPWTTIGFRARSDLGRVGIDDDVLADNPVFLAAARFGNFRRGGYFDEYRFQAQRELFKGFSQRVAFKYRTFEPTFPFGYYSEPGDLTSPVADSYQTSELILEGRYGRDELFLQNDNERISMGALRWPIITARYTHGFSGIWGSDFDYDKVRLDLDKRIKFGPLGWANLSLAGEYVFNTLPYPLLSLHLGNQTAYYTYVTYNLMNYGEFISDHFVSAQYRHHFEGFLLNRVPLLRRLQWRMIGTFNLIEGGLRPANRDMIAATTPTGEPALVPGYFTNGKPYVEVGYGLENIFKFFRIDFIHRLSYLGNPDARSFGVFFSAQVIL
jgi:hypothetical protein